MRSPTNIKIHTTLAGREVEVCITPPSKFVVDHQERLLPSWNVSVSYLILVLQRSSVSLEKSTLEVTQEKNQLRTEFIRFGCSLIFALLDQEATSDLFDPRTGYPLLASPDKPLDDNAVVQALLGYTVTKHQQCSLLTHPTWGTNVYPSIVATAASSTVVNLCVEQIINDLI